jgi:hypothetical protein
MTSATERTDDDVIVITDAHVVDPQQTSSPDAPHTGELPDHSELHAVADDLHADDDLHAGDLAAEDERVHLTTSADATADGVPGQGTEPGGASLFAMPSADSAADSTADSAAPSGSGPFAMPSAESGAQTAAGPDALGQPNADPIDEPGSSPIEQPGVSSAHQPGDINWPEIQSMFVDDPRSAVERAAEVTGAALAGLVAAAKDREQSLRRDWEADGTGTEELRTALQHYRQLAGRLTGISQEL